MTAASVFDPDSSTFSTGTTYTRMWVSGQFQAPESESLIQLLPRKQLNNDAFETDAEEIEVKGEELVLVATKSLSDYHLIALLCWRNFANMPCMTLIESVQRILSPGANRQTAGVRVKSGDEIERRRMTKLEKRVAKREQIENGVLWCVTKLFTNEHNFNGRHLMRHYARRLLLTIVNSLLALIITLFALSYYKVLQTNGIGKVASSLNNFTLLLVDSMCCKIDTDGLVRHYTCFLPSTGEVPKLLIGFVSIQLLILLLNLYQLYKFFWAISELPVLFLLILQ